MIPLPVAHLSFYNTGAAKDDLLLLAFGSVSGYIKTYGIWHMAVQMAVAVQ